MLRPFLWHDTLYFIRQREQFVPLSMAIHVINAPMPLWLAWNEKTPWQKQKSFTYHWQQEQQQGFLQMLCRPQQAQADILYIAPPPTSEEEIRLLWPQKLSLISQKSSQRGLQRLFVAIPTGSAIVEAFLAAGFKRYGRNMIFRRMSALVGTKRLPAPWQMRPAYEIDRWQVEHFIAQTVPATVRAAENCADSTTALAPSTNNKGAAGQQLLFQGDTLHGFVSWQSGRLGTWMEFLLTPTANHLLGPLLGQVTRSLTISERKPIYVAVRHHQQELVAPLQQMGFTLLLEEDQMVKYLALPVRKEELATQAVLAGHPIIPANSTLWPGREALHARIKTVRQRERMASLRPEPNR